MSGRNRRWIVAAALCAIVSSSAVAAPTMTAIANVNPATAVTGQPLDVVVQVESDGAGPPTGSVTLSTGLDGESCVASLSPSGANTSIGNCGFTPSLSALPSGLRSLVADYPGGSGFDPSSGGGSINIISAATSTSLSVPPTTSPQVPVAMTVATTVVAPGGGVPTGVIEVLASGPEPKRCWVLLPATSCNITFLAPGAYSVTASFFGNPDHLASISSTQTITVAAGFPVNDCLYVGPGAGTWDNPSHWSCGVVPGANDRATINSGPELAYDVSGGGTVGEIVLGDATFTAEQNLTIGHSLRLVQGSVGVAPSATITVPNNAVIEVTETDPLFAIEGALSVDGTLRFVGGIADISFGQFNVNSSGRIVVDTAAQSFVSGDSGFLNIDGSLLALSDTELNIPGNDNGQVHVEPETVLRYLQPRSTGSLLTLKGRAGTHWFQNGITASLTTPPDRGTGLHAEGAATQLSLPTWSTVREVTRFTLANNATIDLSGSVAVLGDYGLLTSARLNGLGAVREVLVVGRDPFFSGAGTVTYDDIHQRIYGFHEVRSGQLFESASRVSVVPGGLLVAAANSKPLVFDCVSPGLCSTTVSIGGTFALNGSDLVSFGPDVALDVDKPSALLGIQSGGLTSADTVTLSNGQIAVLPGTSMAVTGQLLHNGGDLRIEDAATLTVSSAIQQSGGLVFLDGTLSGSLTQTGGVLEIGPGDVSGAVTGAYEQGVAGSLFVPLQTMLTAEKGPGCDSVSRLVAGPGLELNGSLRILTLGCAVASGTGPFTVVQGPAGFAQLPTLVNNTNPAFRLELNGNDIRYVEQPSATCTWNVNGAGQWNVPGNWTGCSAGSGTPSGTPGAVDTAVIGTATPLANVSVGADRIVNNLTLEAGRIDGNHDLTITGAFDWSGGVVAGTSSSADELILPPGSVASWTGATKTLRTRRLVSGGSINWTAGDLALAADARVQIDNQLNINVASAVSVSSDGAPLVDFVLQPPSSLTKIGAGTLSFASNAAFRNDSTVAIQVGRLVVAGAATDSGTYNVNNGATLEFAIGGVNRVLNSLSQIAGAGSLVKSGGGELALNGLYSHSGPVQVDGGILNYSTSASSISFASLQLNNAQLTGDDGFVISGTFNWNGGDVLQTLGAPTLNVASGGTLALNLGATQSFARLARPLVNNGTITASGSGANTSWRLISGGITNNATWNIATNSLHTFTLSCETVDCASVVNTPASSLEISNAAGGSVVIADSLTAFNNNGTLTHNSGCATIAAPGVDGGSFVLNSGTCGSGPNLSLNPRSGTQRTWTEGVTLTQNAAEIGIGGRLVVNGATRSFERLYIDQLGVLAGPAAITLSNTTQWKGTIEGGGASDVVNIVSGVAVTSDLPAAAILRNRTLNNSGTLRLNQTVLRLEGTAAIDNSLSIELVGNATLGAGVQCLAAPPCGGIVNQVGADVFSNGSAGGPANSLGTGLTLDNNGALRVQTGGLALDSNLNSGSGALLDVSAGAQLLRPGTLTLTSGQLSGAGTIVANVAVDVVVVRPGSSPGILSIDGNFSATSATVYEMQVSGLTPGTQYDRLAISGVATLDGTLNVTDVGFTPGSADVFDFISFANRIGTVTLGASPYSGFGLQNGPGSVRYLLLGTGAFVVDRSDDDSAPSAQACTSALNDCTLRGAMAAAAAFGPGADIEFNIPGSGPHIIVPTSALPLLPNNVRVDGNSQPGSVANSETGFGPLNMVVQIEIDGSSTAPGTDGLVFALDNGPSRVEGVSIHSFPGAQIVGNGAPDNPLFVFGNLIGLRANGATAGSNQSVGVRSAGDVVVGDPVRAPLSRNVIAGFIEQALELTSGAALQAQLNYIGTDISGTATFAANGRRGIYADVSGPVESLLLARNNVISGHDEDGIRLQCVTPGSVCFGFGAIFSNRIGTSANGLSPLPNGGNGINVSGLLDSQIQIGPAIGDVVGNQIRFNNGNGVLFTNAPTHLGTVKVFGSNLINSNGGLSVDLGGDGRTANDPDDVDVGPNRLQNFPTFTSFTVDTMPDPDTFTVDIEMATPVEFSPNNYPMRLDFFVANGDELGAYLGTADLSGLPPLNRGSIVGRFTLDVPSTVTLSQVDVIVAIATDAAGRSSEPSFYATDTTIVADSPDPTAAGDPYTVTAQVVSVFPTPFSTYGSLTISDGRGGNCLASLAQLPGQGSVGSCILNTAGAAGPVTLTAQFNGSGTAFINSSGTGSHTILGPLPTSTSITAVAPGPSVVGQPYTVTVAVSDGSSQVNVGQVEVRQLTDNQTCTINLASATSCQLTSALAINTAVRATFLGTPTLATSQSATQVHTVNRAETVVDIIADTPDPSALNEPITVTTTLTVVEPGAGNPSGEIFITDGVGSCSAVLPALSCSFIPKNTGAFALEARYLGDANFLPDTDTEAHTIASATADLAIVKRNGERLLPGGSQTTYIILVSNNGPQPVTNARVTDILPPQLSAATWTCVVSGSGSCPATGSGNIDALVSLASGAQATFQLTATVQLNPEQIVSNTASIAPPANTPDPQLGNNESTDVDTIGLHADGFESENE